MKKSLLTALLATTMITLAAAERQVIPIETASKGYYIVVGDDGRAWQGHFGERVNDYTLLADTYLNSWDEHEQPIPLYPTYGTRYTGEPALRATHADGNLTTRLIYDSHTTTTLNDGDLIQTEVKLRDEHYPFEVVLTYKSYQAEDVFSISTKITNRERGDVKIQGAMSNHLMVQADKYWLTRYYGAWAKEMNMVESELQDGITILDSKRGIRTTQDGTPTFILSMNHPAQERSGEVIIGSLAWSGNYKLSFEYDNAFRLQIGAGVSDFLSEYTLGRGESLETPEFVLAHSSEGVGKASRNLHRWVRRYNLQDGDEVRPIVLNSWEGAYFSFDEDIIKAMIEDAASMGVEMFVLDDGWFGTTHPRDNAAAGLGDWEINYKKLPNGLQGLIDHTRKFDIEFGLWVEPEMVNPDSELAERHPDWIVTSPNRTPLEERDQLLLDLSNPKVRDFAHNVVAKYLRAYPDIKYIKWDANRHVEDLGSSYLSNGRQSHFWIDYIESLYQIYDELSSEFPDVIFQACSSGAGRVDYGSLKYHHEVWGSDNTDPESRVYINWGINQYLPAQAVASHVSQSPNHQTDNITPIKFRFDVAMAQRLGVELQPKLLSETELEWTKRGIEIYKTKVRPIVQLGDQYRLISPYSDTGYASTSYVAEDKSAAVAFVYSLDFHYRDSYLTLKLDGLDPDKQYLVEELMPAAKQAFNGVGNTYSGDYLMKVGMKLSIEQRNASAVFMLSEQ
ncbi:MAG: alpha-galactosidase [Rikenellaceae bacterium]